MRAIQHFINGKSVADGARNRGFVQLQPERQPVEFEQAQTRPPAELVKSATKERAAG